jgi:ubiquinol-cytochrome c reductase cytochrome b subunit
LSSILNRPGETDGTPSDPAPARSRRGALGDWLDVRTGYRAILHEALDEPIPGGARWKYVFGSALTATFAIQLVTGLLLMTSYSPSSSTAWGSVYYITHAMSWGWFLRGIHHFGSQAMVVLLVLHLLQVVLAGAYRAPREINWWFGIALLGLTLGFSLTGYLLPWDQKGFWATKVATKIAGGAPVIGPYIEKVIVGGSQYGNQTLTRFYGLHVGILPALLVACLAAHVALFRKHGVTAPAGARGIDRFWPKQVFMDSAASAVVLIVMIGLVLREGGANLDAPADPASETYPARPEWYFLSLFQLLKKFPGKLEIVGTMVVPGAIVTVLLLLPLFDRLLGRRLAHFVACAFVFALVGGAGYLTVEAVLADEHDAKFVQSRELANRARDRALYLAGAGIPPEGAQYLLLRDPLAHGKPIVEQKCLGCHTYGGYGTGGKTAKDKGCDLKGFGARAWIRSMLENPEATQYSIRVGGRLRDGMKEWKSGSGLESKDLDAVAGFVATFATIPRDQTVEDWSDDPKVRSHPGFAPFVEECLACHKVGKLGSEEKSRPAPELFAYGSTQWMARMIREPGSKHTYGFLGKRQPMPAFDQAQMSDNDLATVIRYVKEDYPSPGPNRSNTDSDVLDRQNGKQTGR